MPFSLEALVRDLSTALRGLSRRPSLAVIGTLTLATGLAANVTVISVLDSLLLRPHPFPDLDRLVLVREVRAGSSQEQLRVTAGDFADLGREVPSFDEVAAFRYAELNLGGEGIPENVRGYSVSPDFFPMLGVRASRGRVFSSEEGGSAGARVALVSHGLEKRRFGDGRDPIGSEIILNGRAHTVIGVMPEHLNYPRAADVFLPLGLTPEEREERNATSLFVLARLAPSASLETAGSDLDLFAMRLEERYPESHRGRAFRLLRLREEQYRYTLPMFGMLQIAGVLVLLLAGANVSNLVLVWRMTRRREAALRVELGASRGSLFRQSLAECLALAGAALVLSLPLAFWAVELVRNAMPQEIAAWVSGWREIRLDTNALAIGAATALLLALGMSWAGGSASGASTLGSLQGSFRGTTGEGTPRRRAFLAGAQIALALVLLSGAIWLLRGFQEQTRVFSKLEPRGILTARVALPSERFPSEEAMQGYFERAIAASRELPEVESAGAAVNLPASNVPNEEVFFSLEGDGARTDSEVPRADLQVVAGSFFELFRIPPLRGRLLEPFDDADAPRALVVSETFARRYLAEGEPLGRRIRFGPREPEGPFWTIVGVVSDIKQNWFDPGPRHILYASHLQIARSRMRLAVRSGSGDYSLVEPLRAKLAGIDRDQALAAPQTLKDEIADSLAPLRIIGMLLLSFSGIALLLAATGIYGVVATAVTARTRELGLRMALGARTSQVLRSVLRETLRVAALAIGFSLPATFGLNLFLADRLFGVVVVSPLTLLGLAGFLMSVVAAAAYVPARTASRLDPVRALRWE